MEKKKIILVIVIVAIIVLVALLLYFFLFRSQSPSLVATDEEIEGGLQLSSDAESDEVSSNPVVGITSLEGGKEFNTFVEEILENEAVEEMLWFQEIISSDSLGITLSADGRRIQYYDKQDGGIYSVTLTGTDPVLIKTPAERADYLVWSPDKESFIYKTLAGDYIYEKLLDSTIKELGNNLQAPVFVNNGAQIAYQFRDNETDQYNICVADPVRGIDSYTKLLSLKGNVELVDVSGRGWLSYYLAPSPTRAAVVYAYDLNNGNIHMLIGKAAALAASWSPSGANIAYTKMGENNRAALWLADGDGKNSRRVSESSFVDKIAWTNNSSSLYIASPVTMPTAAKYYSGQKTNDRIYKVDLKTGRADLVLDISNPDTPRDARDLFLSKEDKLLYFRNAYDNSVFVVNLEKIKNDTENLFN